MDKEIIKVAVVAGIIIPKEGKYLMVQEKQPKAYGLWNLPAGRVDVGETIEEAAVREAREETGYEVELIRQVAIFHGSAESSVKHCFEAKISGGELNPPGDEIMDAGWFSFEEIKGIAVDKKLRDGWIIEAISILEKSSGIQK